MRITRVSRLRGRRAFGQAVAVPFNPSVVSDLRIDPVPSEPSLHVSWSSTEPGGTPFQLYVNGRLVYAGTRRWTDLPWPDGPIDVEVGTAAPALAETVQTAELTDPPGTGDRALLAWVGGRFLDPSGQGDVAGFRVYGESTPGGGISYARPLATLPISSGPSLDGFGSGPFGAGGFGQSATRYTWLSDRLAPGTWSFAVKAFDAAGNESTVASGNVAIAGPPGPPAPFADGLRLHYSYDEITGVVSLAWNAPA